MSEVTQYAPGTPCWADVSTTDVPRAAEFYGALFGWDTVDQGEEAGHYTMCEVDGQSVAAIGPTQGGPPAWNTYFAVADADAAAKAIEAAGGTVVAPPFDIFTSGRMAVAQDPTGGFFSVWEARDHIGAQRVNEPGTVCWNELAVRDAPKATAFYTEALGVQFRPIDGGHGTYFEMLVDDRVVGGCMPMDENFPAALPTHWMVYFAVDDCDAAVARVSELGGSVAMPPTDIPPGRFSVVNDPFGAVFSVITLAAPPA